MATETPPDKRILRFPDTVARSTLDANGQENQYMLIRISTSKKGSLLGSDAIVPPGPPTTEDGRRLFSDTLPNKPYNMFGGIAEVNTTIALPMPANYEVSTAIRYDANFEPGDAMKFADFAMGSGSIASKLGGAAVWAALSSGNHTKPGGLINRLTSQLTSLGSKGNDSTYKENSQQVLASQRIAQNPMKEVLFTGMDFRDYSFNWILSPKNASEAAQIREIIATLRYYALPELALGRLYFIFPGVFGFEFMVGKEPNKWIPRIGTSVVESINVDYSPNGSGTWSSFAMGIPAFIRISLKIKEIQIVDRTRVDHNNIKDGGY